MDSKSAARVSENELLSRKFYSEDSAYKKFPLKITLYQFDRCPYCEQVRAYLDFFGFNYEVVDVDPKSKREVKAFTKQVALPICLLEDDANDKKWYLTNATTIISALETLRNEDEKNFNLLVQAYLPILLRDNELRYSNKYLVSENSDLNDMEIRKWIGNVVVPAFKWTSSHTWPNSVETVEQFGLQNNWQARFNALKQIYLYYYSSWRLNKESGRFRNELAKAEAIVDELPINVLHRAIVKWDHCISKFNGKRCPNLADLSFYGVVHAFEGTSYFNELEAKHKVFSNWYREMKALVSSRNGYRQFRELPNAFVPDWMLVEKCIKVQKPVENGEQVGEKLGQSGEEVALGDNRDESAIAEPYTNITANDENANLSGQSMEKKSDDLLGIRILTLNYLAHVFIFSYAAIMRGRWD